MKNDLFGDKVKYEQFAPPFVLVALLNRFDNRYQSAADAFFKELSWKQMFFLNGITLHNEPPTIKDMADFMGCSHQNVNKLYAKLLREGYIISVQDEKDKRKQRLFLTDKARAFLAENKVEAGKNVNNIFSVVSADELETTIEVMAKLKLGSETEFAAEIETNTSENADIKAKTPHRALKTSLLIFRQIFFYALFPAAFYAAVWLFNKFLDASNYGFGVLMIIISVFAFFVIPCISIVMVRFSMLKWYFDPVAAAMIPVTVVFMFVGSLMKEDNLPFAEAFAQTNVIIWIYCAVLFVTTLLCSFSIKRTKGEYLYKRVWRVLKI